MSPAMYPALLAAGGGNGRHFGKKHNIGGL